MNKLQFGSQYNPGLGYDPTINSMENFANRNTTIFDANAGIFYYDGDPLKSANLFGGVAVSHLNRPTDPFATTASPDAKLPMRFTVHGGVRIRATSSVDIIPNALFIQQLKASVKGIGAYSEFKLQNNSGLIGGLMYRINDATIVDVGYHFNNTVIGVSYDFTTSNLTRATSGQGGLELSVSYVFHKRIQEPEPICPRL